MMIIVITNVNVADMERPTKNYDIKFGKLRINFDKIEVNPSVYYTKTEVNEKFITIIKANAEHILLKNDIDAIKESLNSYVKKEAGKSLVLDTDIAQITTNKNDIIALYGEEDKTSTPSIASIVKKYIGEAGHLSKKIVDVLPEIGEDNTLYLVKTDKDGIYKQYLYVDNKFVELDNTEIDLSNYWNNSNLLVSNEINDTTDEVTTVPTKKAVYDKISEVEDKIPTITEYSNGEAINIEENGENNKSVNVLYDNNVLEVNEDNKLKLKYKYIKQVDLNSYEGVDGEVVQHIGNEGAFAKGHLYKKSAASSTGTITLPAGTITNVDSDGNIAYITDEPALGIVRFFAAGLILDSNGEPSGANAAAFAFGDPKIGLRVTIITLESTNTISEIQEVKSDGSIIVGGIKFEKFYTSPIEGDVKFFKCFFKNKKARAFYFDQSEMGGSKYLPNDGRIDEEMIIDGNNNVLAICSADRQYTKEPITLTIEGEGSSESGWIEVYKDFDPSGLESKIKQLEDLIDEHDNEIDDIQTKLLSSAMKYRGEASIAEILENNIVYGDTYKLTDSGRLGNLDVEEGDTVVWNGTEWEKIGGDGSEPVIVEKKDYGSALAILFNETDTPHCDLSDKEAVKAYCFFDVASRDIDVVLPAYDAWNKWSDNELNNEVTTFYLLSRRGNIKLHGVSEVDGKDGIIIAYKGKLGYELDIKENTIAQVTMWRARGIGGTAIANVIMCEDGSKLVKGVQSVEVTEQSIKLGHYAKDEDNLALALGNGTSDAPHNAIAVDWNGNLKTSGNVTDGEGNILSKKATLTDLIVDGRVLVYSSAQNGLVSLTTEELRNILMWVGTEAELDALPDSEIVEGRIYSTFDGTIKRR